MKELIRFKDPIIFSDADGKEYIHLSSEFDVKNSDTLIDDWLYQISARIVSSGHKEEVQFWNLDYSGHNLQLLLDEGNLTITPEFDNAGCAVHDLHELLMMQSSKEGL